jgi:hypothetical protein
MVRRFRSWLDMRCAKHRRDGAARYSTEAVRDFDSGEPIWPPPKPPLAAVYAGMMQPYWDRRMNEGNWHQVLAERERAAGRETEQVGAHNQRRVQGHEKIANRRQQGGQ